MSDLDTDKEYNTNDLLTTHCPTCNLEFEVIWIYNDEEYNPEEPTYCSEECVPK
jgi:uncharacterized protein (UPF0212 family)